MHSAINNSADIRNSRKRSEYDPIWKRIYVERVWRFALFLFLVYYVVKVIPDSLHTKEGAFNFLIFIYALIFLFSIVNYFFIERYWKRIGQRRADALQLAGSVALPSAKSVKADDSALPVPTTLRLQWGRAWIIVLRVALVVLLLLAVAGSCSASEERGFATSERFCGGGAATTER
jgi:hypothetical protein